MENYLQNQYKDRHGTVKSAQEWIADMGGYSQISDYRHGNSVENGFNVVPSRELVMSVMAENGLKLDVINSINHIEASQLKNGYFRYIAVLADGSREIIRKKSTREYLNGYLCSPEHNPTFGTYLRYGQSHSEREHGPALKIFPIQWV